MLTSICRVLPLLALVGAGGGTLLSQQVDRVPTPVSDHIPETLRIATFNVSLHRKEAGELSEELATGQSRQATAIADIVRSVRPDVLVLNEIDYQPDSQPLTLLIEKYLSASGNDPAIVFPYQYTAPVNTGIPSGLDLDGDGETDGPGDCLGYGAYPGQYGMAILSQLPIDLENIRTFQRFRWRDMPGALLPTAPDSGQSYYADEVLNSLPLSSKSHWDVPLRWGTRTIHILHSHPTPPVFDGPEDRNGRRNHDEIRFWADYIDPARSGYQIDDLGNEGGLPEGSDFVIAGDLNADPHDGDSFPGAIRQLLDHPRIGKDGVPTSRGAVAASRAQGGRNARHAGNPSHDTGDFADESVGNLRVDYLLPSRQLQVISAGVFWPALGEPGHDAAARASDHRLTWIDVR